MKPRGLRLEGCKTRPLERPIRVVPPPAIVTVALDQGSGAEATPMVQAGQRVRVGTPVASAVGAAAAVHAPVSGTVRELAIRPTARGQSLCVVIENDGRDEPAAAPTALDWAALDGASLIQRIAAAGTAGLGGAAFPTSTKLELAREAGVELLLLNGAECEPWICCDDALMREHAADVLLGARVMLAASGAARCIVAIEDDKPEAIDAMRSAIDVAGDSRIGVQVLPAVYPLGAEGQLVHAVTGREVPHDGWPPAIGVLCQNVGTAAAVARTAQDGSPVIERIVTVTGSGVRDPANLRARIGTPVADLVAACGGGTDPAAVRIAGGSLTGRVLVDDSIPLAKGLNCVLVATEADRGKRGPELPCIRCGDCAAACPAGLLPQQLHVAALGDDSAALSRYGLDACIECGCCDYVCPSAIPLTQRFRDARRQRQLQDLERRRALEAKARYQRHQRRLAEQAEAEQRAFDEARRRARDAGTGAD